MVKPWPPGRVERLPIYVCLFRSQLAGLASYCELAKQPLGDWERSGNGKSAYRRLSLPGVSPANRKELENGEVSA